jgi:hypothetical protein
MKKGLIAVALLGVVAGILIIWQVVSGLMLYGGGGTIALKTAHRHGGLTTSVISLLYIAISVVLLLNLPSGAGGNAGE